MKNNIVVVTAKPYDLVLDDGKTITVQDEIYIGTIKQSNKFITKQITIIKINFRLQLRHTNYIVCSYF